MEEYIKEHRAFREFFKFCSASVFDIYEPEHTENTLYIEEGDGRAATLYIMGQYGRVAGIHLWRIDSAECHFVIEIKDQEKESTFRLYVQDTCAYSLVDLVYTTALICDIPEAVDAINKYCDTYDKDRPNNLLVNWEGDATWQLFDTVAGKEFLEENKLEFIPATVENPFNELVMNIPTLRREYTIQRIKTCIRGRLSIHQIGTTQIAMIMDPAGGLSSMFSQYLFCMKSLKEASKPTEKLTRRLQYLFPYIATAVGKYRVETRSLMRFGLQTEDDITKAVHALIKD